MSDCTLKVCPNTANRRLFQSRYTTGILNPEVLATLVPPAIERRPLCGLVGGTIADNLNVIFSFCREINGEKKIFCLVTNPRKKLRYRMFTEVES